MFSEKGELCKKSAASIVALKIGQIKLQAGTSLPNQADMQLLGEWDGVEETDFYLPNN